MVCLLGGNGTGTVAFLGQVPVTLSKDGVSHAYDRLDVRHDRLPEMRRTSPCAACATGCAGEMRALRDGFDGPARRGYDTDRDAFGHWTDPNGGGGVLSIS